MKQELVPRSEGSIGRTLIEVRASEVQPEINYSSSLAGGRAEKRQSIFMNVPRTLEMT